MPQKLQFVGRIDVSAANGIQESGGRQTHSRGRKPPVWGKENRSPEAPERTRRQRGPTESVALNMPCAHIRSHRSWLRAYTLALICRPSASSAAPQALQGSISFSCVTGGSHLRLRLDEPPPAICLSSSGLSNSARCARGMETTNSHLSTKNFNRALRIWEFRSPAARPWGQSQSRR